MRRNQQDGKAGNVAPLTLVRTYPVRYDVQQYEGLQRASVLLNVIGRQKAQREINRLWMAYFGIVDDPVAVEAMSAMIRNRRKRRRSNAS